MEEYLFLSCHWRKHIVGHSSSTFVRVVQWFFKFKSTQRLGNVAHRWQSLLHTRRQRWYVITRNKKRRQIAYVHEHLVTVRQSWSQVMVTYESTRKTVNERLVKHQVVWLRTWTSASSHLVWSEHTQNHLYMIVTPFGDKWINVHQQCQNVVWLIEPWLISV